MKKFMLAAFVAVLAFGSIQAQVAPINPILGTFQKDMARARFNKMAYNDQLRFKAIYDNAPAIEKNYLFKAMAMGYQINTLENFARQIRGKDKTWCRNNLHLIDCKGNGVQQLWQDSCAPTTAIALAGELDPIFALKYRTYDQARMQKSLLQKPYPNGAAGGIAVPRGQQGGRGRWIDDILNVEAKATGLMFDQRNLSQQYPLQRAMADMDNSLNAGIPVAICAVAPGGTSHACLVIDHRMINNQKYYTVLDPWTGKTVSRSATVFYNGQLGLSGNQKLSAIWTPRVAR